jgi:hypothetical protein
MIQCDQCGFVLTSDWKDWKSWKCPRHFDPAGSCDGKLKPYEFVADCLKWRGHVLIGERGHFCLDWDGLPVDETTPEIDTCHCVLIETPLIGDNT